jgi:hypothetical protein
MSTFLIIVREEDLSNEEDPTNDEPRRYGYLDDYSTEEEIMKDFAKAWANPTVVVDRRPLSEVTDEQYTGYASVHVDCAFGERAEYRMLVVLPFWAGLPPLSWLKASYPDGVALTVTAEVSKELGLFLELVCEHCGVVFLDDDPLEPPLCADCAQESDQSKE